MDVDHLVSSDGSRVSRTIFYDPEIYEEERRHIFQHSWLYVAHESQVMRSGDFVSSYMGEEPVIVTRASNGLLSVLVNSCSHRGTRICRAHEGNAEAFTCPYHGWRFDNEGNLRSVPYESSYEGNLDKSQFSLHRAARVDQCFGLIFATFDAEAPPLKEYLGLDFVEYLETIFGRSDQGVRLLGGIHRWRLECNWKVPAENHSPDMIHVAPSHRAAFSAFGGDEFAISHGQQITTAKGHLFATRYVNEDADIDQRLPGYGMGTMPHSGPYFREKQLEADDRLGAVRSRLSPISASVFPNLAVVPTNFTIRLFHPRGPGITEVWSWCYVPVDAPDDVVREILATYESMLGPSGILEAEDGENWTAMTSGSRSSRTDHRPFNIGMGIGQEYRHPDLPGLFAPLWSEHNQRGFYAAWGRSMKGGNHG